MSLGPGVQRFLALAILAGLVFAVWAGGLVPIWQARDGYEAGAAQSAELIARYRAVLAGMPALKAEIAGLRQHAALKKGLLAASGAEMAAAALQGKVKASAAAGGAKLISIQVLAAKEEAGFKRVAVRARLSGTVAALRGVLFGLQTAWPALVVDGLSLRARTSRASHGRGAPRTLTVDPDLAIRFDVTGFMAGSPAQPRPAAGGGRR